MFFEEYEFQSILRTNATTLSYHKVKHGCVVRHNQGPHDQLVIFQFQEEFPLQTCCVIVDAGYSFTHVVPYDHGKKITKALIR